MEFGRSLRERSEEQEKVSQWNPWFHMSTKEHIKGKEVNIIKTHDTHILNSQNSKVEIDDLCSPSFPLNPVFLPNSHSVEDRQLWPPLPPHPTGHTDWFPPGHPIPLPQRQPLEPFPGKSLATTVRKASWWSSLSLLSYKSRPQDPSQRCSRTPVGASLSSMTQFSGV